MSWHLATVAELSKALASKKTSSLELAEYFLSRIQADSEIKAYLDVNSELTLSQAKMADQIRSQGRGGLLTGIPIAHKDVFVTRGWRSTAASY
jgi:aspartyl-tRNA(Asn)/glutamyl-tRNA(Gln) amidotransferase subunit A